MNSVNQHSSQTMEAMVPKERTLSLNPLALVLVLLSLATALAALGIVPHGLQRWCAGPALLAGAALPLVARWSPLPPAAFKLTAIVLTLSPALSALVFGAWHLLLDARDATAATAATFVFAHLATLGTRVRVSTFARAPALALGAGVALAISSAAALLRGNEARLFEPALTRAGVALAIDRSLPPQHPWFAGESWNQAWSGDLLAAFCTRALDIAPTQAHALMAVFGALLLPLWLFLLASSLWADARRSVAATALALCAALPYAGPGNLGVCALGNYLWPGPSAFSLTCSIAAWACAGHALRHGLRPWVGLCALFQGLALLLDFSSAWPAALAVVVAALSPTCAAFARPRILLAVALAATPAIVQLRLLRPAQLPPELALSSAGLATALAWVTLAAVGAALSWRTQEPLRRAVLVLCAAAILAAALCISIAPAWIHLRSALGLCLFACALLAAGAFSPVGQPATRSRSSARIIAMGLAIVGAFRLVGEFSPAWLAAGRQHELVGETAGALEPIGPEQSSQDLRDALAFLRADPRLLADRAVLLACPAHNPYRKTRDLPVGGLAACAGIALYGDAPSKELLADPQGRHAQLQKLFQDPGEFDPTLLARLGAKGTRAVVALVRDEDRAFNPSISGKLERMGFERWKTFGRILLYIGPLAAARRYVDTP